ncbi:MAG: hypothetical protein KGQ46_03505 [Hyphomicrobiales bacterium]|nr:hypothetical protein [Hyphomicrobiales bacterium]MDE2116121.1 hypothetical protein [Hyphomicrobiales bacterium]
MARPNRVDPFGQLQAVPARGEMMGNRGGRFHRDTQTLGTRHWASRQWICCLCRFKGRQRDVWGRYYTELFFLDEVTALAAGHRPCFECRREDALAFQHAFAQPKLRVAAMDAILHAERLDGRNKRLFPALFSSLPDGAMFAIGQQAFGVKHGLALAWSFSGYGAPQGLAGAQPVEVLTPPSMIAALRNGFKPRWHSSAA